MSLPGIITNQFGIGMAIAYQFDTTGTGLWMAMGRTDAWPDEQLPPAEVDSASNIDQIIGYKKILTKLLVTPDPNGAIAFTDQNFRVISASEADALGANYVYLEVVFDGDELPLTTFRQVGMYRNLIPTPGFENNIVVRPDLGQVQASGRLMWYENRIPEDRASDRQNIVRRVFQFS